jgi:GT2 family glycosyltransferase
LRRFVPDKLSRKSREKFTLRATGYDRIMFVPYLSGCFMLLRRAALKDVGLFDERFFMYPEDIDITRRIAMKYDTIFYPLVSVRHEYGGASKRSLKMFVVHTYNLIKYFNKWGWFFDNERKYLNLKTLRLLRSAGLDV